MADTTTTGRPPWLGRGIALFFVGLAVFLATGWLLLQLRPLLTLILLALVLSFALEPIVNRLEARGLRRGVGTFLTLLATITGTVLFMFVIGRLVATQSADLIDQGPGYIRSAESWIERTFSTEIEVDTLLDEFGEGGRLGDIAATIAPGIFAVGARVVGILFQTLTVLLFTFYLVAEGPRLRRAICSVFRPERQREILLVWELGIAKTGGYIFSRAALGLCAMVVHWLVFYLLGVPSPLALALWVGIISQFVPVVGTYLAGIVPVLIALANDPADALWVLGLIFVYQQIENYLLSPRITAQTMNIHPAIAFGSVIAGAAILGPVGALLALPLAATGTALISSLVERHEVVENALTASTALGEARYPKRRRSTR